MVHFGGRSQSSRFREEMSLVRQGSPAGAKGDDRKRRASSAISGLVTFSAYLFNVHASDVIDEQAADGVLMASSQRQSRRQSFSSEHPSKLIQDHPKVTDSFEPDGLVMIGI